MRNGLTGWALRTLTGALCLLLCPVAIAQNAPAAGRPIEVTADRLAYDREGGVLEGIGNVRVVRGNQVLTADYITVDTGTEDASAFGNVTLSKPGTSWTGERLLYNFRTGEGSLDQVRADMTPFIWQADDLSRASSNTYVLAQANITTCTNAPGDTHYHIRAKRVTIMPGAWLKARHAVWHFGHLPVFYLPYYYRNLQDAETGWYFQPGYHSRMGLYSLNGYRQRWTPWLKTDTHFDYRTRRGIAVGQDVLWHDPGGRDWYGDVETYYLDDANPIDEDEDATGDIDSQRYRVRLRHTWYATPRDYMLSQAFFLSDTDVREDFFTSEYHRLSQPENYLAYTHRGDDFVAGAQARLQLNDFYTVTERLPELFVDVSRQELGRSGLYVEGDAEASWLNRAWASASAAEDYSTLRIDVNPFIYYPTRAFGFLNLVPRAGYRATWYADTLEEGVEAGSGLRSVMELGQEVSFKAFRIWDRSRQEGRMYRHVIEPYADYTYVPEPNLTPDQLYQFDRVDTLGEKHRVKLGLRNRLQSKAARPAKSGARRQGDLIDLDIYTYYRFVKPDGEEAMEDVYIDGEFQPLSWMTLRTDAELNVPDGTVDEWNTRLYLRRQRDWSLRLEQRYRRESSNLWTGQVGFRPSAEWSFDTYTRVEFEDSRLEEVGGYAERRFDCMVVRTGASVLPGYTRSDGTEREGDWRVTIAFWLTAFPTTRVGLN